LNVVAQFIGRKRPDKSGNYKDSEVKGFQNAKSEGEAKTEKPLPLVRGDWRKDTELNLILLLS
jgi:hypothetical protein